VLLRDSHIIARSLHVLLHVLWSAHALVVEKLSWVTDSPNADTGQVPRIILHTSEVVESFHVVL
jgi:hypothetical protein